MKAKDAIARICEDGADPRTAFSNPQEIADAVEASYEERHEALTLWLRDSRSDAETRDVDAAIQALQKGAAVSEDGPEAAPDKWGYGVPRDGW
jgi:hypothetical protein